MKWLQMLGRNTTHREAVGTIVCVPCVDRTRVEVQVTTIGTTIGTRPIVAVRTNVVQLPSGVVPVTRGGKK